jgi:hypothetical protein
MCEICCLGGVENEAGETLLLFAVTNGQSCIVKISARVDMGHHSNKEMPPWPPVNISKLIKQIMTNSMI